jgi:coenzyme F420-reducing hydrogenase gamma subunit
MECKGLGLTCVTVAHGTPCLGPVTQAGCGALCPSFNRGCFGCFGPMESPNVAALMPRALELGLDARALRTFNVTKFEESTNGSS